MVPHLTPRQQQILECIQAFYQENRVAPTFRELQERIGLRSVATIAQHIKRLRALGLLHPAGGRRSLLPQPRNEEELGEPRGRGGAPIPFLGFLTSKGIETLEIPKVFYPPPGLVREQARAYALQLRSQEYQDYGLLEGDLLIVEAERPPNAGELVLARSGLQWWMGTFAPDGDYVCLTHPETEQPLAYHPRASLEVIGIVLGMWRFYQR